MLRFSSALLLMLGVLAGYAPYAKADTTVTQAAVNAQAKPDVKAAINKYFQARKFKQMKISPDGKHVAFTYDADTETRIGFLDLTQMKLTTNFEFGENMHVVNFHWANNERVLMEVSKITGHLVKGAEGAPTLYAGNIDGKDLKPIFVTREASYQIINLLPNDDKNIMIARQHYRDNKGVKSHLLNIYTGKLRYIDDQPNANVASLMSDNDGNIRLALEFETGDEFDDNRVYVRYKEAGKWLRLNVESQRKVVNIRPVGFSKDNKVAYLLSNHDQAKNDTLGLFSFNFETTALTLLFREPNLDLAEFIRGENGELIATQYVTDAPKQWIIDKDNPNAALLSQLTEAFAGDNLSITSYSQDGSKLILSAYSDVNPGQFYLFDKKTKKAQFLADQLDGIVAADVVPMLPVRIKARDGLMLPSFLTMPRGVQKQAPMIVFVHGGPYGVQDEWGFVPDVQFLANQGYAVLQVNYRGSGGYGDDFQRAGRLQWGKAMQDDVTDATLWAIEQGYADRQRICIYGGSYGGYAALWGVIKEPNLYQCAVGYVGVYDMPIFFRRDGSDASSNPSTSQYLESHVGEGTEYLTSISPAHHTDKIKVPVLIVHGSKDVRVPMPHAESLEVGLKKHNVDYKMLVMPDGHGFYKMENKQAAYSAMAEFFAKHLAPKS